MDDLKRAEASDLTLKSRGAAIGNQSQSLGEMEAKLKADPKLFAFYTKHALSADDAVVMPFVLMSAGVAAAYP